MGLAITVPYTILWDSGVTESVPADGATATVKFKCLWTDHYQLVKDLMWSVTGSGKTITRIGPLPYPAATRLFCRSIDSIEPLGKPQLLSATDPQWLVSEYAVVTATFAYMPWIIDPTTGQQFTQTSCNISGELLTIPGTSITCGGVATGVGFGINIPQMEISQKRYFMPYIPFQEMISIAGKVNSDALVFGDAVIAAGYLLFLGGSSEYSQMVPTITDPTGKTSITIDYKFMWRAIPWNKSIRPSDLSVQDLSPAPYATAAFSGVLP